MRLSISRQSAHVTITPTHDAVLIDLTPVAETGLLSDPDSVTAPAHTLSFDGAKSKGRSWMPGGAAIRTGGMIGVVCAAFLTGYIAFSASGRSSSARNDDPHGQAGNQAAPTASDPSHPDSRTIRQAPSPNADFGLD